MTFKPGNKKLPTSGRKAGTPNKVTTELKDFLLSQGLDPALELTKLIEELEAPKRADILVKILEFIYPRRKAVEGVTEVTVTAVPAKEISEDEHALRILKIRAERFGDSDQLTIGRIKELARLRETSNKKDGSDVS